MRYPVLDVNVSLILGETSAVVVDTLATAAQAKSLVVAVRAVTTLPLTVVNTHQHFDHCFGNAAFKDCDIWAHELTATPLRDKPEAFVRRAFDEYGHLPGMEGLADVTIVAPRRLVRDTHWFDIGGRDVVLRYLGRGHTAGDLVVTVDGTVIAGDLVEAGASPSFEDSFPLEWPETVAALLDLCGDGPVVPGHGEVMASDFVAAQHARLAGLSWMIREGHADGVAASVVVTRAVAEWDLLTEPEARLAVKRGYEELSGLV